MIESQDAEEKASGVDATMAHDPDAADLARRQFRERRVLFSFLTGMLVSVGILIANVSALLPGSHPDAIHYMEAGRSWAEDGTLGVPMASWNAPDSIVPLSHYPPGYSLAIGGVMRAAGVRPLVAVLWLEALSGGATVGLSFWIGSGLGGLAGGFGAAFLIALLPAFVRLHLGVWSEPLFLPFVLLAVASGARTRKAALLLGLFAGFGTLIRYVGVALAGFGVLDSARGEGPLKEKALRGLLATVPSLLVIGIWSLLVDAGGEEVREFHLYGDLGATLFFARHIPEALFLPLRLHRQEGMYLLGFAALMVPALGAWGISRIPGDAGTALRRAMTSALLYFGVYLAVMVAARLLADPFIPLDDRLLLPGLLPLAVLWGTGSALLLTGAGAGRAARAVGVLTLAWWLVVAGTTPEAVKVHQREGMYYTHRSWLVSDLVYLAEVNRNRYPLVYSNDPGMVFFHTGRVARKLPTRYGDAEGFREHFAANPGMILVFRSQDPRHMVEGGLGRLLGVAPNYLGPDGAAYLPGVEGMVEINRPSRSERGAPPQ